MFCGVLFGMPKKAANFAAFSFVPTKYTRLPNFVFDMIKAIIIIIKIKIIKGDHHA